MRDRRMAVMAVMAAGVIGAAGCGTNAGWRRTTARPADDTLPTVYVRTVGAVRDGRTARVSQPELTQMLAESLRSEGVRAVTTASALGPVDYILTCKAPELGYATRGIYPKRVSHAATLACVISDSDTGGIRWQRLLRRDNDLTRVVDTMSRLPGRGDVELLQLSLLPAMDDMAYSVRLFLERPAELRRHAIAADGADAWARALVRDVERWTE
jgi:hypothetical protein